MARKASPSPQRRPRGQAQATPQTPGGPAPAPSPSRAPQPVPRLRGTPPGLPRRPAVVPRDSVAAPTGWCGLVLGSQPAGSRRAEAPGATLTFCFPRALGEAGAAALPSWSSGPMPREGTVLLRDLEYTERGAEP